MKTAAAVGAPGQACPVGAAFRLVRLAPVAQRRRTRQTTPCPGHPILGAGYSLLELIIALGILAVALPIVASAFLVGALENAESIQDTMGTLVAENALAVVRARVTHTDLMKNPVDHGFGPLAMAEPLQISVTLVDMVDLEWDPDRHNPPAGAHQSGMYGCVVMAQRLADDSNDYRLIAMPYRKFQEKSKFKSATVEIDDETGLIESHEVLLDDPGATQSADVGILVCRTALRP